MLNDFAFGVSDVQENITRITRRIDVSPTNPARYAAAHMDCLVASTAVNKGNSSLGQYWEHCVYGALVAYGISPDRIEHGVHFPDEAEVDWLIRPHRGGVHFGLMLKTSIRERWKQCDRDARVILEQSKDWKIVTLIHREKAKDSDERMRAFSRSKRKHLTRGHVILAAADEDLWLKLFDEIKSA